MTVQKERESFSNWKSLEKLSKPGISRHYCAKQGNKRHTAGTSSSLPNQQLQRGMRLFLTHPAAWQGRKLSQAARGVRISPWRRWLAGLCSGGKCRSGLSSFSDAPRAAPTLRTGCSQPSPLRMAWPRLHKCPGGFKLEGERGRAGWLMNRAIHQTPPWALCSAWNSSWALQPNHRWRLCQKRCWERGKKYLLVDLYLIKVSFCQASHHEASDASVSWAVDFAVDNQTWVGFFFHAKKRKKEPRANQNH